MKNKTRHTNRWGMRALLCMILGVGIQFTGCEKPPETVKKPATKVETQAPAKAVVAKETSSILDKVETCADMIAWYKVRSKYLDSGTHETDVDAALGAKERELLEKVPAQAINDSLELVAFDWRIEGEDPGKGKGATFLVSWLFNKKGDINYEPDHQVLLVLRGIPDKSHARRFETETLREKGYFEFTWDLVASIDTWEQGEYYLVTKKTYIPVPNLPYNMLTNFSEVEKREDGKWHYLARYGERLNVGWYAGLGE